MIDRLVDGFRLNEQIERRTMKDLVERRPTVSVEDEKPECVRGSVKTATDCAGDLKRNVERRDETRDRRRTQSKRNIIQMKCLHWHSRGRRPRR